MSWNPASANFKIGNQLWREAMDLGAPPKFKTPQELAKVASDYFEWVEENPLLSDEVYGAKEPTHFDMKKMRAMTIQGLCIFARISLQTWHNYKAKSAFIEVCSRIESVIYNQKFEGAASGLLNPNIIARDLGLVDKKEVENKGEKRYVLVTPSNNRKIAPPAQRQIEVPITPHIEEEQKQLDWEDLPDD